MIAVRAWGVLIIGLGIHVAAQGQFRELPPVTSTDRIADVGSAVRPAQFVTPPVIPPQIAPVIPQTNGPPGSAPSLPGLTPALPPG
ncbi:MAG TPA: hypothetical protein VIY86_00455, partial [Pirellulaceae bacterium]